MSATDDPKTQIIATSSRRRREEQGDLLPTLTVLEGPEIGAFYAFADGVDQHIVGRADDCAFTVDSPAVSRQHAHFQAIEVEGQVEVEVEDRGSTNGVLVNGLNMGKARLHSGDKIRMGDVLLRFEWMTGDEVSYHREVSEKLKAAARDHLTGLLTRAFLENRVEGLLKQSDERGRDVCCILLDMDHFKSINDSYGHLVGDAVLQRMAAALRQGLRRTDFAIRYGGEEMLLITPGLNEPAAAEVAERLRRAIASIPMGDLASDLTVSASLGVAQRNRAEPLSEWIARADAALYTAKDQGRDRVILASALGVDGLALDATRPLPALNVQDELLITDADLLKGE